MRRRRPIARRMNPRRGRLAGMYTLLAAVLLLPSLARAQEPAPDAEPEPTLRLGPSEIRDEHLLAQPRLTLPATTPDTLGQGRTAFRASVLWSNSFGWTQNRPGEHPADRRFLIDGEAATLDVTVTHGFRENLDAGFRLPLTWRGGGRLDGLIDAWHRLFNLPDGNRPDFLKDAFRVEGVNTRQQPFSWNDERGFGLGSVEAFTRWRFSSGAHWTSALVGRLALPTATGPFAGNGPGLGLQWVAARRLGPAFDLFLGAGGTAQPAKPVRGVGYEPVRGHGFLALEWRPWRSLGLAVESDIASRLIRDIDRYPGIHWIINGELRLALSKNAQLELGFTENFMDQIATTDFAVQAGLRIRPASRRASRP
jgi:Protein of unknown function (DUF3187)